MAISHVVDRLKHAINYVQDNGVSVTALVVVGGVAANKELRRLDVRCCLSVCLLRCVR